MSARVVGGLLVGLVVGTAAHAQERGLRLPLQAAEAYGWQARVEQDGAASSRLGSPGRLSLGLLNTATPILSAQSLRLMGDLPLEALHLGSSGGLRLTGGLLINLRQPGLPGVSPEAAPTLPYAGVGYSSNGSFGSLSRPWGRLGFTADVGLAAGGLGVTLGNRGLLGLGIEGGLRDLRLTPMLRLGMNLAF